MKKITVVALVVLLLTSCTSLHTTRELFLVDEETSNSAVRVNVIPDGIIDSHAGFFVEIENNTDSGINFFENQITFFSGHELSQDRYISTWNSYAFLNLLENEYSGKLTWAAFFYDMFDDDYCYDDDGTFTFFKLASFFNLAATGIDAAAMLGNSSESVLRSCYIPAGETMCGLVFCEVPWRDNFIKVNVNAGGSSNKFTFTF